MDYILDGCMYLDFLRLILYKKECHAANIEASKFVCW